MRFFENGLLVVYIIVGVYLWSRSGGVISEWWFNVEMGSVVGFLPPL